MQSDKFQWKLNENSTEEKDESEDPSAKSILMARDVKSDKRILILLHFEVECSYNKLFVIIISIIYNELKVWSPLLEQMAMNVWIIMKWSNRINIHINEKLEENSPIQCIDHQLCQHIHQYIVPLRLSSKYFTYPHPFFVGNNYNCSYDQ